jgi:integrase
MKSKNGKFYARWWDESGRELSRAFPTLKEARRYQGEMRAEARARKIQGIGSVGQETARWLAGLGEGTPRDHWHERVVSRDVIEVAGRLQVTELNFLIPNALIERWNGKYSVAALYNLRFRLKSLCRWLELRGAKSLVENLRKTPTPQARQVLIDSADLEKMKAVSPPWFRCFILFCFDGGLRRGEALRVAPMHYSVESGKITIEVKKRRVQSIQVTDELRDMLAMAATSEDPSVPFLELLRGRPMTRSTIELWFAKIKKKAGAAPMITTHDLRRTAATNLYLQTRDLSVCQKFLGHANPITTLRYIVHADNVLLKPMVEQMKVAFTKRTAAGSITRAGGS